MILPETAPISSTEIPRQRPQNFFHNLPVVEQELADRHASLPVKFQFSWASVNFEGVACLINNDKIKLRLTGDLGVMPYSSEAPKMRQRLMDLVDWRDPAGIFCYALSNSGHLGLIYERDIVTPSSRAALLAATAQALIEARPYLELAGEVRVGLADFPSDGGSTNT